MPRPILIPLVFSLLVATTALGGLRSPNVVLILADDLGWADTQLYGKTSLYETPNLLRLARRGMTFSRAYADSPLCSPTRSAILTGLSPAHTGLTTPNCHLPKVVLEKGGPQKAAPNKKASSPAPITRLDPAHPNLAKSLQAAGYATGHFGKWHLGAPPYSPLEQGFDVDIPHWPGPGPAGSFVAPWRFPDFDPNTPDEHIEDRMAQEAVAFLEEHQKEPFFLNYWMFSVHAPFDAKDELIEKYQDRVHPADPQRSSIYAGMIESMDDAVGTLLDTLDRLELWEKTVVLFYSDNGGNMYNRIDYDNAPPTSNAPLRGGKATLWEGGVRIPCVISYPPIVAKATRSNELVQGCDLYPTLLGLLGIEPDGDQVFDGISIVPALKGEELEREALFSYFPHDPPVPDWLPPSAAVTTKHWKLIRLFHQGPEGAHRHLLYNIPRDIGETRDLADRMPEKVTEFGALLDDFLARTQADLPQANPSFDPAKYRPELEGFQAKPKAAKPVRPLPAKR